MPNPAEIAQLVVNGSVYSSWTSVRITRTAGEPVGTFDFVACEGDSTAPNAFGQMVQKLPTGSLSGLSKVKVGDACQIILAGHKVIDGFIVTRDASLTASDHTVLLQGASKTYDIVRGAPPPQEFKGYGLTPIVNALISSFGGISYIPPENDDSKPLQPFRSQFGETAFEAIERLGRMRGVIFSDDENGSLVGIQLAQAGATSSGATLSESVNILQIRAMLTDQAMMGKVVAVGQQQGSDQTSAGSATKNAGIATNSSARQGVDSYIVAEHPADADDLTKRANHEVARQIFTSVDVNVLVQGWFKPNSGDLWKVVESATIYSPSTFTSDDGKMTLATRQVTYLQDSNGGTRTSLDFCLPNALTNLPDVGDVAPSVPSAAGQQAAKPAYNSLKGDGGSGAAPDDPGEISFDNKPSGIPGIVVPSR